MRDRAPPSPAPSTGTPPHGVRPGNLLVLLLYCLFLFCCSAFLYRAALWSQASGYGWLGEWLTRLFLGLIGTLFLYQAIRAFRRKRYAHLLFLCVVVFCFFPAYFNLGLSLERFHLLLYGVLGILVFRTLAPPRYSLRFYLLGLNLLLGVSTFDEILQGWVADRYYDIRDIWTNIFSGMIGLLAVRTMDLSAPLPLHPPSKHEHPDAGVRPPPLIDLHIYRADLLLMLPVAVLLLFDARVTQLPRVEELAGAWRDRATGSLQMRFLASGEVRIRLEGCEFVRFAEPGGNALDGYRIRLIEAEEAFEGCDGEAAPCAKQLRELLEWKPGDRENGALLVHPDLGPLDRVPREHGAAEGASPGG